MDEDGVKAKEFYEKGLDSEEYAIRNAARCDLGNLYDHVAAGSSAEIQ